MLARTRARLVAKIEPKLNSSPLRHFTKHLVGVFGKPPREKKSSPRNLELFGLVAQEQHRLHPATIKESTSLEQHLNKAEIALGETSKLRKLLWRTVLATW
jgi:hypothetical protein